MKLYDELAHDYGHLSHYTVGQILTAYGKAELPADNVAYAFALYMDRASFEIERKRRRIYFDYETYRRKIHKIYFQGHSFLLRAEGVTSDIKPDRFPVQYHGDYVATASTVYPGNRRW